jgi:hypothetical protein
MSKTPVKNLTTKYSEFESERLTFTTLEENERSKGQKIAYPRYNHPSLGEGQPLLLQGPWMTMFAYGVPTLGEFYKEDKDRAFVKVPLDINNPEIVKMIGEFKKIDEVLGADSYKKENFGKYDKKYTYQPIVRFPLADEDEEVSKPPYMKLKLDLTWPEGNVKTEVFNSELLENGKRERKKLEVDTVTEFANKMSYMCKFRGVFRPVKMWAHQSKMKDPGYGLVFKLIKVEVEPNSNANSAYNDYLQGDVFVDDDDEEVMVTKTAPATKTASATKTTFFEETSENKDPVEKNTKATNATKATKAVQDVSESDDSDSENKDPVEKNTKATKAAQDDSCDSDSSESDSDDSEEEPVQKKVVTKKVKGKKASA